MNLHYTIYKEGQGKGRGLVNRVLGFIGYRKWKFKRLAAKDKIAAECWNKFDYAGFAKRCDELRMKCGIKPLYPEFPQNPQ